MFQNGLNDSPFNLFANIFGLKIFLVQIFFLCISGQRVSTQCDLLSSKLYEANFLDIIRFPKLRKIYIIFMAATQEECTFFVGKILPLNLETFSSVCSAFDFFLNKSFPMVSIFNCVFCIDYEFGISLICYSQIIREIKAFSLGCHCSECYYCEKMYRKVIEVPFLIKV